MSNIAAPVESLAVRFGMSDLIAHVESRLEPFADLTEPYDVLDMERDRAALRGDSKDLNQRRIAAEKAFTESFNTEIKVPVRKLTDLLDETAAKIDVWIKDSEAAEAAKKRGYLVEYWTGCGGELAEAVPFAKIENPKWANKTFALDKAYEEMDARIEEIAGDLELLAREANPVDAKAEYLLTLDYKRAVKRSQEIEESRERARKLEEARQANLAAIKAQPIPPAPVATPAVYEAHADVAPEPDRTAIVTDTTTGSVNTYLIEITCTRDTRDRISAYMRSLGVTGRIVK